MDLKNITGQLDRMADEIQAQDPVLALAIDRISDSIESRRLLDLFEKTLKPADKQAGMESVLQDLVKTLSPWVSKFVENIPVNSPLPAQELIWKDPYRLQRVLNKMTPGEGAQALEQVRKILGILAI